MRAISFAAMVLVLVACMSEGQTPGYEDEDACGASGLQGFVGKPLSSFEGQEGMRVIRPGALVTRDYRAARLNVGLDENDVIVGMYCG